MIVSNLFAWTTAQNGPGQRLSRLQLQMPVHPVMTDLPGQALQILLRVAPGMMFSMAVMDRILISSIEAMTVMQSRTMEIVIPTVYSFEDIRLTR